MFDVLVTGEQWPNPEFESVQAEILNIDAALRQLQAVSFI